MAGRTDHGAVAVVLAAGSGTRARTDGNKAYLPLAGRRMASWTLQSLARMPERVRVLLVIRAEDRERAEQTIRREAADQQIEIIVGGSSRHDSEHKALEYLAPDIDAGDVRVVLIHDAARPLAGPGLMQTAILVAREFGGAVPALPIEDIAQVGRPGHPTFLPPQGLVRVQTPQAFRADSLLGAYRAAAIEAFEGTDTASVVERFSDLEVKTFHGDERNMKVTYPIDLFLAEDLLARTNYRLP